MCKSVHPNRCLSLAKMEVRSAVSTALFVLLTISLGILWMCDATIQVERPRGVSLSNEPFYNKGSQGEWFTCIDGSMKIHRTQINDDYCDCPDSSDEPGTSACPDGRFHCNNRGYRPYYIPSSRVNDGICDCCDASDEYEGPGAGKCVNNCKELGKKDLEERKQQMVLFNQGFDIRQQYINDGLAKKTEREGESKTLQAEKEEAQRVVDEKKKVRDEVEGPETEAKDKHKAAWEAEVAARKAAEERERALQAFKELDIDSDGRIVFHELANRLEFDTDSSGDLNEEEAKAVLGGANIVEEAVFVEQIWNDVKEKFKFAHELAAEEALKQQEGQEQQGEEPAAFEKNAFEEVHDDIDEDIEDEWAEDDDEDEEDFYEEEEDEFDEDLPEEARGVLRQKRLDRLTKKREMKDHAKPSEDEMPDYDDATKALIAAADQARKELEEAEKALKNIDRTVGDLEKQLRVDLGPDQAFQALQGQCYEYTDREYTYKLCPFEKSSQRSKNGGSETSLGSWHQWEGPPDNKYSLMMYTKGQKCWNGPDRSTRVNLRCGVENRVLSASEPDRCVYQFEFTTPALCTYKYDLSTGETDTHDEL
ncbi:glucosidase 2 subunit beta [Strongylocentrotus purpuratus]|uniref:Glucosidase 2 subunit beta n=1 Tax=Strongylocentrotus purpuratus TaxID=7668 RepID=A0A7M7PHI0_STRPU|nr:glucosidase 2 subunit beta [Strongylocentrotus purpuratus]